MLSTSAVNSSSMSAFQREIAGNSGASETGMFDFMNYLLGLQGQSQDWLQSATEVPLLASLKGGEENVGQDDALLSLFEKKNQSQLDPIALSGLFPQNTTPISNPITIKNGAENLSEIDGKKGSKDAFSQGAELKNALFALEGQGLTSMQMLQRSSENSDNISKESANSKPQKENALQQYLSQQGAHSKSDLSKSAYKNTVSPASQNVEGKSEVSLSEALKHSELSNQKDLKSEDKGKGHHSDQNAINAFALNVEGKYQVKSSEMGAVESKGQVVRASLPELFEKVQGMVHHGNGKMTVALNPPTLGQVEIHVTTRGKNVEISMKSENDFAKSAIESSIGDLKASMEAQDLNLTKMEVQVHRDLDKHIQGDFTSNWVGQDAAFQQSRGFTRDNSPESPWREPSGSTNLKSIGASSRLGAISSTSRSMPVGDGRVDIRI